MHYNILSRRRRRRSRSRANRPTEYARVQSFDFPSLSVAPRTFSPITTTEIFQAKLILYTILHFRFPVHACFATKNKTKQNNLLNIIDIFLSNCDYQKSDEWKLVFLFFGNWNWFLETIRAPPRIRPPERALVLSYTLTTHERVRNTYITLSFIFLYNKKKHTRIRVVEMEGK